MSESELEKVAEFSRTANTDELLDRVTAFRADHDSEAIRVFERELRNRGIGREELERRTVEMQETVLKTANGAAIHCYFCDRPATVRIVAWHRLWGKVPLFPRPMSVCGEHVNGRV